MTTCKFIPYQHLEESLFKCEVCGYITPHANAERECVYMYQPKYDKTPSALRKIANFTKALGKHLYKGMPTVSKEELDKRLAICQGCELYKKNTNAVGGVCTHESCGCSIQDSVVFLNKIAWADQECPLKKWLSINANINETNENRV
jgi:hypothetical protein